MRLYQLHTGSGGNHPVDRVSASHGAGRLECPPPTRLGLPNARPRRGVPSGVVGPTGNGRGSLTFATIGYRAKTTTPPHHGSTGTDHTAHTQPAPKPPHAH